MVNEDSFLSTAGVVLEPQETVDRDIVILQNVVRRGLAAKSLPDSVWTQVFQFILLTWMDVVVITSWN